VHFVEVSGTSARCSSLSTESWSFLNGTCGKHRLNFVLLRQEFKIRRATEDNYTFPSLCIGILTLGHDQAAGKFFVNLRQGITRGVRLSKITERALIEACYSANNNQLKSWDSGLKVERYGVGFAVYRLYRRPRPDRQQLRRWCRQPPAPPT